MFDRIRSFLRKRENETRQENCFGMSLKDIQLNDEEVRLIASSVISATERVLAERGWPANKSSFNINKNGYLDILHGELKSLKKFSDEEVKSFVEEVDNQIESSARYGEFAD